MSRSSIHFRSALIRKIASFFGTCFKQTIMFINPLNRLSQCVLKDQSSGHAYQIALEGRSQFALPPDPPSPRDGLLLPEGAPTDSSYRFIRRAAFVPPNPNEFESA